MKLTGTCTLLISGVAERALVEFDISEQSIAIWRSPSPDPDWFFGGGNELWNRSIYVRDIEVFSPTAVFRCKRLPSAFLRSWRPSGLSVDDGEINKVMAIGDGQVHSVRLSLTLRKSRLPLKVEPFRETVELQEETVFTNHSKCNNESFSLLIGRREIQVRYSPKHIFLSGRLPQRDIDLLRYACSLVALSPEQVIATIKPPDVTLNYSWERCKAYNDLVVSPRALGRVLQQIVSQLQDCEEEVRRRRFHEITHLVGGFQQKIFVEDRLTNLLKALESFDETKTLSANRLTKLLKIDAEDARFLCGVRNCLVHQGMPLAEAARRTYDDLRARRVQVKRFARLPKTKKMPWRVYVTFSRVIVSAYFDMLGVGKTNTLFARHKGF